MYSIVHDIRHDVELWQESDSFARVRERCLVFKADASAVCVAVCCLP